ncbi:MAG: AI-2E family transporter [Methanoregulaceae archaeon]|nr:AI-2E family transporter [Methanoregulaceae archaeon]
MTSGTFRYDLLTIILLFLILITIFVVYFPLAAAIILGLTLAIVMQPLNQRLAKRLSPAKSAALVTLLVVVLVALGLSFMVLLLINGSGFIFSMIKTITAWLATVGPNQVISGAIVADTVTNVVAFLKSAIIPLFTSLPVILFQAFIMFLSVYLFLLKGPHISGQIMNALPGRLTESVKKISGLVVNTMYAIYIVSVEVAILAFILALPIYYLLGYPAYLPLAIMSGIAMFIPIIGPLVVMLFLILYNLATGDIPGLLVAVFIIFPVVFWIPGSLVRSKLMGKRTSIHPVLMMIGIIGGISVMGIIGLILGPLFIALLVSSYEILIDQMAIAKGQETEPVPQ